MELSHPMVIWFLKHVKRIAWTSWTQVCVFNLTPLSFEVLQSEAEDASLLLSGC